MNEKIIENWFSKNIFLPPNPRKIQELSVWWNPSSMWYFKDCEWVHEPLPFYLEDVHDWYVKWNELNVQHTPEGKWVEYDPQVCGTEDCDSYKHPSRVFLDGEEFEG